MDPKTLFVDKLPQVIGATPDKARALDAIYVFKVSGDSGGTWTVDLRSDPPCVRDGEAATNDCVVEIADTDLQTLLSDPSQGMSMFIQGRIRVTNPLMATKLTDLLKMV